MLDDVSLLNAILEPIKTMLPWSVYQELLDLPEAKLIVAIIMLAIEDANAPLDCSLRRKAREWFKSETFFHYCELIGTDARVILSQLAGVWGRDF